jgi:hypothetical protein
MINTYFLILKYTIKQTMVNLQLLDDVSPIIYGLGNVAMFTALTPYFTRNTTNQAFNEASKIFFLGIIASFITNGLDDSEAVEGRFGYMSGGVILAGINASGAGLLSAVLPRATTSGSMKIAGAIFGGTLLLNNLVNIPRMRGDGTVQSMLVELGSVKYY